MHSHRVGLTVSGIGMFLSKLRFTFLISSIHPLNSFLLLPLSNFRVDCFHLVKMPCNAFRFFPRQSVFDFVLLPFTLSHMTDNGIDGMAITRRSILFESGNHVRSTISCDKTVLREIELIDDLLHSNSQIFRR